MLDPLTRQNAVLAPDDQRGPVADDVLERVVQRALSRRGATYVAEVRRLMDAGLAVMLRCGVTASPRVADIVAEAGLSNDAFYRYFASKGALVGALMEDGAEKLRSYLAHQMAKEHDPERQVHRWVEGIFTQSRGEVAAATRAVMWNSSTAGSGAAPGRHFASEPLAVLLEQPFAALGSAHPAVHARLAAHGTLGRLTDHLWAETAPTSGERGQTAAFWVAAARGEPAGAAETGR